ncbi:hypothetical protein [Teredinibacter sp. KSP-S5-2]|uniref:hypothetical protein n=1 Tax=Teredinibacter sp. KSP-S5-2 TaxID=3034506 RepID=UPI002934AC56|nr:hypothetical protein [Teredinibacter sp. KSP-S5-2]WNO07961.1 hypothetical protein P5V12_13335 [Teredinibacter sp. KSP-S5-2]
MKKVLVVLVLSLVSSSVFAGSGSGTVEWVRVRASDNLHYFKLTGAHNSRPNCATNSAWTIKDENSPAGKTQISILMAAWVSGKEVEVVGNNDCTRWGDIEDANEVVINQG